MNAIARLNSWARLATKKWIEPHLKAIPLSMISNADAERVMAALAEIVIETQQEPEVILALRVRYRAGFDEERAREDDGRREQAKHDAQMQAFDAELQARRRAI